MDNKKGWHFDDTENPEKDAKPFTTDLLEIMDGFAQAVEMFTGFKQQFMSAGWSEENAEAMVLHVIKISPSTQT